MPAQLAASDGLHKCKWRSCNSLQKSQQHNQCKLQNVRTNITKVAGTPSHLCNGRMWGSQLCHCARCKLLLQPTPMHGSATDSFYSCVVITWLQHAHADGSFLGTLNTNTQLVICAHLDRHISMCTINDTGWLPYPSCNTGHSVIVLLDNLPGMHVSPFYSNSSFSCFVSF